jgi:predicted nucleotidyltransferase
VIRPQLIESAVHTLVAQGDVEEIYVIGSHAIGTAHVTSDLDLILVQRSQEQKPMRDRRAVQLLSSLLIPVDVNAYTPEEFAAQLRRPYSFVRLNVEGHGKQVYSRARGFTLDVLPGGPS